MHFQKTRKEGSSTVMVIPHAYCRELGIVPGDYVTIRTDHNNHLILGKLEDYLATRQPARHAPPRPDRATDEPQPDQH